MSRLEVRGRMLFVLALCLFSWIFVRNAWVVDDAYITFRTVDNFVAGYGSVWNVEERVQAYSHPLWMLLQSGVSSGKAQGADPAQPPSGQEAPIGRLTPSRS